MAWEREGVLKRRKHKRRFEQDLLKYPLKAQKRNPLNRREAENHLQ